VQRRYRRGMSLSTLGWPGLATHPWAYPALEAAHVFGIACWSATWWRWSCGCGAWRVRCRCSNWALCLSLSLAGFRRGGAHRAGDVRQPACANCWPTAPSLVKLGLIMLAGINAAFFHARGGLRRPDGLARVLTVVSLGLWLAVIICGRWIAYR
jgi:hypothetical protein